MVEAGFFSEREFMAALDVDGFAERAAPMMPFGEEPSAVALRTSAGGWGGSTNREWSTFVLTRVTTLRRTASAECRPREGEGG